MKFVFKIALLFFILSISGEDVFSQNTNDAIVDTDSKREEVQRYFGYELLLYRYLSLPYDASINVNEHGSFVEIGFLYILFFPILLLLLNRKRIWLFSTIILFTIFSWVISTSNSFVYSFTRGKVATTITAIDAYLNSPQAEQETLSYTVASVTKFSLILYQPFLRLGESISGNKDGITYPIIIILFLLGSILLSQLIKDVSYAYKYFIALFWSYAFFWFSFSGGIIWYGYILLFLAMFLINIFIRKLNSDDPKLGRIINGFFICLGFLWIVLGITSRVSNIQTVENTNELGKGIFNPVFYEYGLGKTNNEGVLNKIYPNLTTGLRVINDNPNSLVWRIGTSFTYFIDNNTERVVIDNQLGMFYELHKLYPDQNELAEVFKSSNVRYFVVDLNTAQIDKTPQKTLTEKYRQFMLFLINNPKVSLLATDRILQRRDINNNIEYFYGDFGEVYQFGRYSIYEVN